jgi:hypothetical protein
MGRRSRVMMTRVAMAPRKAARARIMIACRRALAMRVST